MSSTTPRTDGTRDFLQSGKVKGIDRLILQDSNRGKGAALRTGIRLASSDVVVIQDADLEYDPNDYRKLIKPILAGKADVVFGSRFLGAKANSSPTLRHYYANLAPTFLSNRFSNLRLTDIETGFTMFWREVIQAISLKEDRFGFDPEIAAKIARMNLPIKEVPISYRGRSFEEARRLGGSTACDLYSASCATTASARVQEPRRFDGLFSLAGSRRALCFSASFSVRGRWCLANKSAKASSASSCRSLPLSRASSSSACQDSGSKPINLRFGAIAMPA